MKALLIGGTGPAGPHIIRGLLHGAMTSPCSIAVAAIRSITEVERLRGDPHFPDTLETALGDRNFDLVIATYGRIQYVAEVLNTRTDRLITVRAPSYGAFRCGSEFPCRHAGPGA